MKSIPKKLIITTTLVSLLGLNCGKKEDIELKQISGYNYVKFGQVPDSLFSLASDSYDFTGDGIKDGYIIDNLGNFIVLKNMINYFQKEGLLTKIENNELIGVKEIKFLENQKDKPDLLIKYKDGKLILYKNS
mgnify:CR=1 FL=1